MTGQASPPQNISISPDLRAFFARQKRGTLTNQSASRNLLQNYFAPRMASLQAFATRNFTTRLAGIWMVSPVAGLRP